jgi:hypothetical protein
VGCGQLSKNTVWPVDIAVSSTTKSDCSGYGMTGNRCVVTILVVVKFTFVETAADR